MGFETFFHAGRREGRAKNSVVSAVLSVAYYVRSWLRSGDDDGLWVTLQKSLAMAWHSAERCLGKLGWAGRLKGLLRMACSESYRRQYVKSKCCVGS